MKIYRLPEQTGALIFDMDLTLYTCEEYARTQIDDRCSDDDGSDVT